MSSRSRAVTAALVAAVTGLASLLVTVGAAPAHADACPTATGVTVVVDFNELGGGVQGDCVAGGGGRAAVDLFQDAGFPVNTDTPGNPGYVCQVSTKPGGCGRPDGSRFWSLWWSDGKGGSWTFSSLGVRSLTLPDGASVAFSWDQVAGEAKPSYTPPSHGAPAPQPSPQPSQQPTASPQQPSQQPSQQPTRTPTAPGGGGAPSRQGDAGTGGSEGDSDSDSGDSAAPGDGPTTSSGAGTDAPTTAKPTDGATAPSGPPSPSDPTTSADTGAVAGDDGATTSVLADPVSPTTAETEAAAADDDGLPGWLAPLVIVLLFGAAGLVLLLQRRRQTQA